MAAKYRKTGRKMELLLYWDSFLAHTYGINARKKNLNNSGKTVPLIQNTVPTEFVGRNNVGLKTPN